MRKLDGFTRGVNFGGWLSQCDHTKKRYDTFITEDDFKAVSERGFDHVRVPVDYELFEDDNMNFEEEGFKYIDFAIAMCKKYSIKMILDLHRTPGYSFDPFHGEKGFFEDEKYQEHFYVIWEELAKRYGDEYETVVFELLNEVTKKEYCDTWNRVSTETIKKIRAIAPDIRIIVGGYYNNSLEAVRDLAMPYDDKIIYTFHCYEPLLFTHQGAYWIATMDHDFRCEYKMPYSQYEELSQKYLCQAYCSFKGYDLDAVPDEAYFDNLLQDAIKVAEERNVPLYCGEYGVIDKADRKDAALWFKDFHSVMDRYGIGRAVWNYKEMDFEIAKDF
ncbi:MAG: cellulase family glycosylhydrolase [Eubacterium sp.]|nr:cellulase family glycosylhydrolase [Eubacterium sp.]